ncbi:MAG: tetratricopeptide repeat protein [bacterium]
MIHRIFFWILFFVVVMLYLSHLNPETVQLHLTSGTVFPISMSLLIISSMGAGVFVMMTAVVFRDARKGFAEWREKGRLKKKAKIMDLYRQGIDDLLSRKREDALKHFQKILEWDPNHLDTLLRIGEVCRYNGNLKEAVRYHTKARAIGSENLSVLFALSKDYWQSGQMIEAAEIYRTILNIDNRNVAAFLKLREFYEREGAWDKAYALQKDYWNLKKDPEEKKRLHYYQFMSAEPLHSEKDRERLIRHYSELIRADRTFAAPYLKLGKIYELQGDQKEAVKIWKKGFKETGALVFLEVMDGHYRRLEDPAKGIQVYKEAIDRYPENPVFKFLLGKFYYRLEMVDDALDVFESLVQEWPGFPILRQILGDLYHKRGRTEEAFLEYRESVNFIRPVLIPYSCTHCGNQQAEWIPCCKRCGKLETMTIQLPAADKAALPSRIATVIHHD